MGRAVAILGTALLAATLGLAQGVSTSGAASNPSNSSASEASSPVRGCLSSSSLGDDRFTLTQDQTGTVFTLEGEVEQLRAQVGHQVEVTGQDISNSQAQGQADAGTAAKAEGGNTAAKSGSSETGNHALRVTNVRVLSDHCEASSVNPPAASPSAPTKVSQITTPGTPSVLRLLGFVGLCSLAAGFVVRK
jgi:hypothetical protein